MRGADHQQSGIFSYISAEKRVPKDHPLRAIRVMADAALEHLGPLAECATTRFDRSKRRLLRCKCTGKFDGG